MISLKTGVYIFLCTKLIATAALSQNFVKTTGIAPVTEGSSFGVSWIDFDNDGHLDLFVANYEGKNHFYRNLGNGDFEKITTGKIASESSYHSSGPSWADFDNDGFPDLFIATQGTDNILFRNMAGKEFIKITKGQIVNDKGQSFGSAWADYDNDGYVDLYVTNNTFFGKGEGESDFLYKNNGDGTFERKGIGLLGDFTADNTGASWCDYDNDGWPDLFVTTWNGKNMLFRNIGGGNFTKMENIGLDDHGYSISATWADFDNDGWMDLYVGNGYPDKASNYLYRNNGDGTFTKNTQDPSVVGSGHYWNVVSGDFDNDGDVDLFVPNFLGSNELFVNNGDGSFTKIAEGIIPNAYSSSYTSGAMWADYDNDGDLDLFVANASGNNDLFKNEGNNNHWIQVKLTGTVSNRSAIGARIKIKAVINGEEKWQMRDVTSCQGFRSSNHVVHFGLADASMIDSLVVMWPSGQMTELVNVSVNQILANTENIPADFIRAGFSAEIFMEAEILKVQFKDKSAVHQDHPILSYEWDFNGNGIIDSKEANPQWIFQSIPDTSYSVSLKVTNVTGSSLICHEDFIMIEEPEP